MEPFQCLFICVVIGKTEGETLKIGSIAQVLFLAILR